MTSKHFYFFILAPIFVFFGGVEARAQTTLVPTPNYLQLEFPRQSELSESDQDALKYGGKEDRLKIRRSRSFHEPMAGGALIDRAILAAYLLNRREATPERIETLKSQYAVTEKQIRAASIFILPPNSTTLNWTAEQLAFARSELNVQISDFERFISTLVRASVIEQLKKLSEGQSEELENFIDATVVSAEIASEHERFPYDLTFYSKLTNNASKSRSREIAFLILQKAALFEALTRPKNSLAVLRQAVSELSRDDQAYFLISVIKELTGRMELQLDASDHALFDVGRAARQLLNPLLLGHSERAQLLASEMEELRMADGFGYYMYSDSQKIHFYIERYRFDMSLRSDAERERAAIENLKSAMDTLGTDSGMIARRDQLLVVMLDYVSPRDLPSIVEILMSRTETGEAVGMIFIQALVSKLDRLSNAELIIPIKKYSYEMKTQERWQTVDFLMALSKSRQPKSNEVDAVLSSKMKTKILSGMNHSVVNVAAYANRLETYRTMIPAFKFLHFVHDVMKSTYETQTEKAKTEKRLGLATVMTEEERLQGVSVYEMLNRYQQAMTSVPSATNRASDSCNALLYKSVSEFHPGPVRRTEAMIEKHGPGEVIPFPTK